MIPLLTDTHIPYWRGCKNLRAQEKLDIGRWSDFQKSTLSSQTQIQCCGGAGSEKGSTV